MIITSREALVSLVDRGFTIAQIAKSLDLSRSTIQRTLKRFKIPLKRGRRFKIEVK
jgi:IS30 family transposase